MNAPLSRYLTRFSADPSAEAADALPAIVEPTITLRVAELDARLADAREGGRAAAEATHAVALAELTARQEAALADAVAASRAAWVGSSADSLLARFDGAMAALRETMAEATARVLRPLLADATRTRTLEALEAAIARLLADPARSVITLHAPADLIEAIRARGAPNGLELVVADTAEAVIRADGTHIETRLAAALAGLAGSESGRR